MAAAFVGPGVRWRPRLAGGAGSSSAFAFWPARGRAGAFFASSCGTLSAGWRVLRWRFAGGDVERALDGVRLRVVVAAAAPA